jgi:UDP-glucose 4-epimerase
MRVLITGGAGFIGSHIADGLVAAADEVLVVDDLSTGHRENIPAGAHFVQLDIRDRTAVERVFAGFKPEAVSHQAAQTSVSVSTREPLRDAEINILGTIHVAQAAAEHGVSRLVFASTGGAIYGEVPEGTKAGVDTTPLPLSPYACSKLAAEHYLRMFHHEHGMPLTILRYANVYGPRQDPHGEAGVVAIFCKRLLRGEPVCINAMRDRGDDGCVRDYVAVTDVVSANLAALHGRIGPQTLNVCTGVPTTTMAIARGLMAALGASNPIEYGPKRAGDLERSVLDERPMVELLGVPMPFAAGLQATADWFRTSHEQVGHA